MVMPKVEYGAVVLVFKIMEVWHHGEDKGTG